MYIYIHIKEGHLTSQPRILYVYKNNLTFSNFDCRFQSRICQNIPIMHVKSPRIHPKSPVMCQKSPSHCDCRIKCRTCCKVLQCVAVCCSFACRFESIISNLLKKGRPCYSTDNV